MGVEASGQKGRGLGGRNFCPLALSAPKARLEWEAFPPFGIKLNIKAKQFSIPFKRKRVARKIQKIERKLFCFARRISAGGNAGAGLKIKIWIFVKKGSDFNQKAPPIFRIRILGDCCLAPPEAGLGFGKDFEGIFEVAKQFLPAQTEVRFAESKT